jgi:sodium-dependent multivitamin transporter 6
MTKLRKYSFAIILVCLFCSVSFDPRARHTIWSLLIGGTFNFLSTDAFSQSQVQRFMCIHSTRGAKQALIISAIGASFIVLLCGLVGIILYAYYAECDPYTANYITDVDQIFPYFVMDVLGDKKGLPGLFLACIFSGSLSTISTGLNSLSAVLIEDIYKGLMGRQLTDQRQGALSKILSVIIGVIIMMLTYVVTYLGSILNAALSLFGVLFGPIMGVFVLGFFFPQANKRGGLIGFLVSLVLQIWIFVGAQVTRKQRKIVSLPLSIASCNTTINIVSTNVTASR